MSQCGEEGLTSLDDFDDIPVAFLPCFCNTIGAIADLVAHGHVPTIDKLEFVGMVRGDEELFFEALCLDLGLDPSTLTRDKDSPLATERTKGIRPPWLRLP
jgi:hypothetical protein